MRHSHRRPHKKEGDWLFGCFVEGCAAHNVRCDEVGFLMLRHNLDWKEAQRMLLDIAGIPAPAPAPQLKPKRAAPEPPPAPEPAEEISAPVFIVPPKGEPNPYEAAWALLELTPAHRKELSAKRGLPDSWIDALGFRSAIPANARTLAPLLELYPPNVLLRSGLASRDPRDYSLRIADSICGRFKNEETDEWETQETVIIPYVADGRITLLRPHKRSLSNSRWREREAMSAWYEKLHNNLRMVYGEHLITERPEEWKQTVVLCEGEHKANALRLCGIPAIAFQGIHFFLQNAEHRQAIETTAKLLRKHGVRQVIVVFDNEDKSDKEFHKRFEAETYARFTAECLEDCGFQTLQGMLPDEWREGGVKQDDGRVTGGKADWDARLAWQVRQSKGDSAKGIAKAKAEFTSFLNHRGGKDARIRPVQRQVDYLDAKEDVINQALHRLRHVQKIFTGGAGETELASELQNNVPEPYATKLRIPKLTEAIRGTIGGYYRTKAPTDKMVETCSEIKEEVLKELGKLEDSTARDEEADTRLRQLRATLSAINAILYKYPKPFTDFTSESKYKVLVTEADGSTRMDRLIVFKDSNGMRSRRPFQLSSKLMRSAQELRSFFLSMGHYHWFGGQEECDLWCQEIDVKNYQKVIEEIDTYGWNREGRFYLLGDCAVLPGGEFKFPDRNGIIWVNGTGYKNSDNMASFTTKPPCLFPNDANPAEAYLAIDWEQERLEILPIWQNLLADYKESFGGYAGFGVVSGHIQYLAHPEVRQEIGGKPGLWVQGEKGSGKTKSIEFLMRMIGYPLYYGYISLGGTKVGVERSLCQFSNLPFHIDEWRNENADPKLEDLIRNSYNETATPKGTPNGNKGVRKLTPSTIPIITGEDGTTDPALRSRYISITSSQYYDQHAPENETDRAREARRVEEQRKRDLRYDRIMKRSDEYYRVGRYLFKHRDQFAAAVVERAKQFATSPRTMARIKDSRARQNFGVFFGAISAAQQLIAGGAGDFGGENQAVLDWFINHGAESSESTEHDVFRRQFFAECVTMINRGVPNINKYIRAWPCYVNERGLMKPYDAVHENARIYILIASKELFTEYQADKRKRGENAPIAINNIMAELRTQQAWVPVPKAETGGQHRIKMPDEKGVRRKWWVLDYKRLDPELRNIFQAVRERELSAVGIEEGDDGDDGEIPMIPTASD